MNVLYITAYKDIGRGNWNNNFKVNETIYYEHFNNLAKKCKNLICFLDKKTQNYINNNFNKNEYLNTKIYDYDEDNTFFKDCYNYEKNIMNSYNYKNLLKHRLTHPEHSIPEYNIVNHNKVIFIKRAMEMFPEYDYYIWIDFHYMRYKECNEANFYFPYNIDNTYVSNNKISICSFIDESIIPNINIYEIAYYSKEIIQGSAFIVPKNMVDILLQEYIDQLQYNYNNNIADDDQNIHLAIFIRNRNIYNLIKSNEWGKLFSLIKEINNKNI